MLLDAKQSEGKMETELTSRLPATEHLEATLANPQWVAALNRWSRAGGLACETASASAVSPDAWPALQAHLIGTGWFEVAGGKIAPTGEGRGFLERINELYRSQARAGKEDAIVEWLLADIPRGAAVDIGCGPGHSVLRLARLGYSPLYAYDLSPVALAITRALLARERRTATLYARDATSLAEVEPASLALIYSRSAFHYFNQPALAATFSRALRPGGHIIAEIVGLQYYLQAKHLRDLLRRRRWWRPASYGRVILRTLLYETFGWQPRLAAGAPEIGYTVRGIHRLARRAGLEVLSVGPAPALVGYLVVMRKPAGDDA